jgi:ABC-type lipoprotein release transport system permease subunit
MPRDESVFPSAWYVTPPATATTVGASGTLVVRPTAPVTTTEGVPLLGALAFFLLGTREAVSALGVTAGGAGLLIVVTVYSVSRMSVRDRLAAIRVIRATGGSPRTVVGLFTLRAGLVTAAGVALGYATGVIVAHGTVTLAVAAGVSTALPVSVTPRMLGVLGPLYVGLVVVGAGAGAAAARPVARCPPGRIGQPERTATGLAARLPPALKPRLLGWRALVPTAATVTAFVAFVVLVAGLAGAAGPVLTGAGATVTEPGSSHPVNSRVPAAYAPAIEARGVDASGEILLFTARDGQPFVARGAAFAAFANVTDARLRAGEQPTAPGEAVIGAGLARTLDIRPGERLTLGGSTRPAVAQVRVVGTFTAPGPYDDQLVVGLPTARHLAGMPAGSVQFIRTTQLPDAPAGSAVEVTELAVAGPVVANGSVNAQVTIRNLGLAPTTQNVTIRYRGQTVTQTVRIPATTTQTVSVTVAAGTVGRYPLQVANRTTTVTVRNPAALSVELPARVPAESEPLVRVRTAAGTPVSGATVALANRTRQTGGDGQTRLPPVPAGTYTVTVTAGERQTTRSITVTDTAARQPEATLTLRPATPSLLDRPVATVRLVNPWNRTLMRTVRVTTADTATTRAVRLTPGASETVQVRLSQQPPGTYTLAVRANATRLAETTYRVTGDERVLAAVASSGRAGTTGLGQAVAVAVGNLQVVVGALFGLAAAMTIGGTTAVFAQAVHARRRTLGVYRATGAAPLRLLRIVIRDALLVGSVATAVGLVCGQLGLVAAARAGYLTVFGVRLAPTLEPAGLAVAFTGGVVITLTGAVLATVTLLGVAPVALLDGPDRQTKSPQGDHDG